MVRILVVLHLVTFVCCFFVSQVSAQVNNFWADSKGTDSSGSSSMSLETYHSLERNYWESGKLDELERLYETEGRKIYNKRPEKIDTKIAELLYVQGRFREAKAVMYHYFQKLKMELLRKKRANEKRKKIEKKMAKKGLKPRNVLTCGHAAIVMGNKVKFMKQLDEKCPSLWPWQVDRILKERAVKFGRAEGRDKK